jgi:hypothetical protein
VKFFDSLLLVLYAQIILVCVLVSNKWLMNGPSVMIVLFFNAFFVLILSQLHGSIAVKSSILIVGNLIGTTLNLLFYVFAENFHTLTGLSTSIVLTMTYPLLNFIWIIPFWSLSLSLFSKKTLTEKVPT